MPKKALKTPSYCVLGWSRTLCASLPRALSVGVLLAFLRFPFANAQEARRGFAEFYKAATDQGFQLGEEKAKIEFSKAREDFASSKGTPNLSIEVLSGPTPGAEGNAVDGRTDWNKWGAFLTSKAELIQPLYTFGAISRAVEAAGAGTRAEEALLEKEKWLLRTQVAELYYGFQLAFEFSIVAEDFEKKLDKALEIASKRKVSRNDLEKIRSALTEAKIRRMEAEKGSELARSAMSWKIGEYQKSKPKWDRANIEARVFPKVTLEDLQKKAEANRPEIKALAEEVRAKEALARSESAQDYPSLFLGARASYGYTPVRETQRSPFANDPFNTLSGGAALGLKWNLSFWERSAKVSQARAEAEQARVKQMHLRPALLLEVEKNYRDLQQSIEALELRKQAAKFTRDLYQDTVVAYGLGTGSAKQFLEAAGNFALAEKSRLDAIYSFNMNSMKLEQVIGQELSSQY